MTSQYRVNYHLRAHKRDNLIEFIKGMLLTPFVLHSQPEAPASTPEAEQSANAERYAGIFGSIEALIDEHRDFTQSGIPTHSRLAKLVPTVGTFFTRLPLERAFRHINHTNKISARKHVPPSFNDIRRILNMAQVMAIAPELQLVTFDGDMTLYADGQNFEDDSALTTLLIGLLRRRINVAIVTAAGYGADAGRYELRLSGLLRGFAAAALSADQVSRFFVLGGECNFMFRCRADYHLEFIDDSEYASSALRAWTDVQVQQLLDVAEAELADCVQRMGINAQILRKPRAVGLVPQEELTREQLDECALSSQLALLKFQGSPKSQPCDVPIPFCAFNGGSDCWVDIGNKLIGVRILQELIGSPPNATLHVGDQFLSTGNDISTRAACCTCWIISPHETQNILTELETILGPSDL
ncbi:IMP 5'-nucleotidase [Coemansia sp. RSA 2711]|nr:IMP 5'-nucleotidase [Coemansia sp. RSA 2711]KAJ2308231.1 IMP 5'-nucleotidase [Coemansia sp. RSA 2705]KAJ2316010.1 IMP 5'-nucleotidase [Coemansia sp. RSA 2704]KAJ2324261.1 IMP 5'-nucleotidase [Coemansia sp. RSA 2702]KAJ2364474.1 IMP 5'-nucleotidase [Coemansia sp. RSA 2610]KAJ2385504.1 IMP 5'-nucleotidase [Coemansia sp. RSA 2611]KAJ2727943.1 IMP 5'-nucleotidase [Coemansia sp. Cherry 401B]